MAEVYICAFIFNDDQGAGLRIHRADRAQCAPNIEWDENLLWRPAQEADRGGFEGFKPETVMQVDVAPGQAEYTPREIVFTLTSVLEHYSCEFGHVYDFVNHKGEVTRFSE